MLSAFENTCCARDHRSLKFFEIPRVRVSRWRSKIRAWEEAAACRRGRSGEVSTHTVGATHTAARAICFDGGRRAGHQGQAHWPRRRSLHRGLTLGSRPVKARPQATGCHGCNDKTQAISIICDALLSRCVMPASWSAATYAYVEERMKEKGRWSWASC